MQIQIRISSSCPFVSFVDHTHLSAPSVTHLNSDKSFASQPDRTCGRMRFDMADADVPVDDALFVGDAQGFAGEDEFGLAAGLGEDFHVRPGDSAPPACSQNLENGLLGGESSGKMLEISLGIPRTIRLFQRRETPVKNRWPCSSCILRIRAVSTISIPCPTMGMSSF